MERAKKIVLEAPAGYNFVISQKGNGEVRIKLICVDTEYSENYINPPIPEGWEHVEGEWDEGYVIQDSKGNQFVWIPVGFLDANGTLDGTKFYEKFGRRKYQYHEFSDDEFHQELEEELRKQCESVRHYGGFYISRYNISKNQNTGEAQSVKGEMPWTNIDWNNAMKAAKTFGDGVSVRSHLPFGEEYDSTLEWFIESGERTREEIEDNSKQWGNFWDTYNAPKEIVKTGTREDWFTKNIGDFAGNVDEWTQEEYEIGDRVIRGGNYGQCGEYYPVAERKTSDPSETYLDTGFRAALFLAQR